MTCPSEPMLSATVATRRQHPDSKKMPGGPRPVFWLSPLEDRTDHQKVGCIEVVQRSRTGPSHVRSRAGVFGGFSQRMGAVFAITSLVHRVVS